LREICGFLNTTDGILLIGVRDKKNRTDELEAVSGIERDGFSGDEDKYGRQIHDLVKDALGVAAASLVSITIEEFSDQHICRIECKKSAEPVYCTYKENKGKFFVRYGSSTAEPPANEVVRWIKERF